jgi:putative membrane protein
MTLDAVLAYLHYMAIFVLFAFLTAQALMLRAPLDERGIRLVGRADIWYAGAAVVALATGLARAYFGAKGIDFYLAQWSFHAKVGTFVAVALLSIKPTIAFIRWRKALERDPAWRVPLEEQARMRRIVMIEVHVGALIPVFAVMMARGLGT